MAQTAAFRNGGRGGATYDVIDGRTSANGMDVIGHDSLDLSLQLRLIDRIDLGQLGAGSSDDVDDTPMLQRAVAIAEDLSDPLPITGSGTYKITDTIVISGIAKVSIRAETFIGAIFEFHNDPESGGVQDKPLFLLSERSSHTEFEGIWLKDRIAGSSTAIQIEDDMDQDGRVNYKNIFTKCRIDNFSIGFHITTDEPLNGQSHAMTDSITLFHCSIFNCRIGLLNNNVQAINTHLISVAIHNWDPGEQYTMIRDEAGGGITATGCSFIGRGHVYHMVNESTGNQALWFGGYFNMNDSKVEARPGWNDPPPAHVGEIFCQDPHFRGGSSQARINVTNTQILLFGQTLDLLQYGRAVQATFTGIEAVGAGDGSKGPIGKLVIDQHPTSHASGHPSLGSLSSVIARNCTGVVYRQTPEEFNLYGIPDGDHTGLVEILSPTASTMGICRQDSTGFFELRQTEPVTQTGIGLSPATFKTLVFGRDKTNWNIDHVRLKLPRGARPLEFFIYKQPIKFSSPIHYNFYLVKDEADWGTPGSFAVETDAVRVGTTGSTQDAAGYFRADCVLRSNVFGGQLKAGEGNWTEGRIYFERTGSAERLAGWVGVNYL